MQKLKRSDCAVLPLVLKDKWFCMIFRGEKREEYRDVTSYWVPRIFKWDSSLSPNHVVEFRLGYSHDAPRMSFLCSACFITDELHHPEWGELATIHFVISLGERVELED